MPKKTSPGCSVRFWTAWMAKTSSVTPNARSILNGRFSRFRSFMTQADMIK